MTFGATEIFIVVAVLILLFGAKKIPELARGIGQGIKEFKRATDDPDHKEVEGESKESSTKP
jgi:sec-independent protein translocase protein TatA